MALAQVQYTQSVAGNKNFSVSFPYISKDHIKVAVNGLDVTFTWTNASTVSLTTAPAVGDIVDVRRETERVNLLVDFQDASTITEAQLDLSAKQSFFIAQEAFDATGGTLSVSNDGSYSAAGRQIRDIGAPTNANDAVNKQWVMDQYNSGTDAGAAKTAAEAARDKAKRWADDPENTAVETGKYSAKHHAIKAAASATAAANSAASIVSDELLASQKADEAAASAAAAATSKTGADTAKTAAQAAQSAAETAKTAAEAAQTTTTGARDTTLTYRDTTLTYRDAALSAKTGAETARDTANSHMLNAQTYDTNAANSAASASNSMNKAYNWAESAEDYPVEPGKYSAKHHATKAAASASAAAASASASQTSADASAASATEAAGYAAGVNMPSAVGQGGKLLRQKSDESGFEYLGATTSSRVSPSTLDVLQAKAMSDHVASDDHDSRYAFCTRFTATVRQGSWSRIGETTIAALGSSYIISLGHTRNSVVVNVVFLVSVTHARVTEIVQLVSSDYSQLSIRGTDAGDNNDYIEVLDNNLGAGDHLYTVVVQPLDIGTFTPYTSGYVAGGGTVSGSYSTTRGGVGGDGRALSFTRTTASGANAHISTSDSNTLYRSTSARKYKTDIEDAWPELYRKILDFRPVWYRSVCEGDNPEWGHWGFIAEEVAEIDPRFVNWDSTTGEVEGLAYDRMVVLLQANLRDLKQEVEELKSYIAESLAK